MWLLKSMKYWKQDFWDILEAVLCSYLEVWDIIIYSPNLTGLGQVRSLVIRDYDTKVTDHGWDRFISVSGHSSLPFQLSSWCISFQKLKSLPPADRQKITMTESWNQPAGHTGWGLLGNNFSKPRAEPAQRWCRHTHSRCLSCPWTACTPYPALSERKVIFSEEQAREQHALACSSFTNKSDR